MINMPILYFVAHYLPSRLFWLSFGNDETSRGASTRAAGAKALMPDCDYWCGIEGGVANDKIGLACFAWVAIEGRGDGELGMGKSSLFYLPPKIKQLIDDGMELGDASDVLWGTHGSKQQGGSVGLLTKGALSRRQYCEQAVICALIPLVNRDWYPPTTGA